MDSRLPLAQAVFLAPLALHLEREGVRVEEYLNRFGLKKEILFRGDAVISKTHHVWGLLDCVSRQEGCDDLGFQLGFSDMFACGGALSQSLMHCETFYEALNGAMGALSAYIQDERIEFHSMADVTHIDFVREHPGFCPTTEQIAVQYTCLLLGLLSSRRVPDIQVHIRSASPRNATHRRWISTEPFHFEAPVTRISIPSRVLAEPIRLPRIPLQHSISPSGIPESESLTAPMRAIVTDLMRNGAPPPSVFEASSFIEADRKTLYRNLLSEGTSYSRIVQSAKYRIATELLTDTDLPISEVSDRLHFGNPNNFCRAFKARSGLSPRHFRRLHQASEPASASQSDC